MTNCFYYSFNDTYYPLCVTNDGFNGWTKCWHYDDDVTAEKESYSFIKTPVALAAFTDVYTTCCVYHNDTQLCLRLNSENDTTFNMTDHEIPCDPQSLKIMSAETLWDALGCQSGYSPYTISYWLNRLCLIDAFKLIPNGDRSTCYLNVAAYHDGFRLLNVNIEDIRCSELYFMDTDMVPVIGGSQLSAIMGRCFGICNAYEVCNCFDNLDILGEVDFDKCYCSVSIGGLSADVTNVCIFDMFPSYTRCRPFVQEIEGVVKTVSIDFATKVNIPYHDRFTNMIKCVDFCSTTCGHFLGDFYFIDFFDKDMCRVYLQDNICDSGLVYIVSTEPRIQAITDCEQAGFYRIHDEFGCQYKIVGYYGVPLTAGTLEWTSYLTDHAVSGYYNRAVSVCLPDTVKYWTVRHEFKGMYCGYIVPWLRVSKAVKQDGTAPNAFVTINGNGKILNGIAASSEAIYQYIKCPWETYKKMLYDNGFYLEIKNGSYHVCQYNCDAYCTQTCCFDPKYITSETTNASQACYAYSHLMYCQDNVLHDYYYNNYRGIKDVLNNCCDFLLCDIFYPRYFINHSAKKYYDYCGCIFYAPTSTCPTCLFMSYNDVIDMYCYEPICTCGYNQTEGFTCTLLNMKTTPTTVCSKARPSLCVEDASCLVCCYSGEFPDRFTDSIFCGTINIVYRNQSKYLDGTAAVVGTATLGCCTHFWYSPEYTQEYTGQKYSVYAVPISIPEELTWCTCIPMKNWYINNIYAITEKSYICKKIKYCNLDCNTNPEEWIGTYVNYKNHDWSITQMKNSAKDSYEMELTLKK